MALLWTSEIDFTKRWRNSVLRFNNFFLYLSIYLSIYLKLF